MIDLLLKDRKLGKETNGWIDIKVDGQADKQIG